jgi:hypothetical protein
MELVLSLQALAAHGSSYLELTSSESTTCSSESTGGCVIKTGAVELF